MFSFFCIGPQRFNHRVLLCISTGINEVGILICPFRTLQMSPVSLSELTANVDDSQSALGVEIS